MQDYVAELMNDPASRLMGTIPEWVQKHEPELRINPYLRDRTNIASNFLVPHVLQTPPILATIESLNVSVAAGIILYEALRQRTRVKANPETRA